ncbi:Protein of unknown function DUF2368 family-containing protein [Strongyloides ratti]|uniref:Uncharacterized protein n=1 Tax=Strongyloides ratti TaxID=34506 RepID=A0A090L0K9_STRRB|nr:Protein of unknown function DUF2368 family-containing protein [Strongyloides ratti]CEF61034.1 Protein of unknown function DUF2368 family-containing protein [Strongyloides ratti]
MNLLKKQLNEFFDRQFESEIVLQELLKEKERAIELSKKRELFGWMSMCLPVMACFSIYLSQRTKNKTIVFSVCPFIMIYGYYCDEVLGSKFEKIKNTAELIMSKEPHLLKPVGGTLTLYDIDKRIKKLSE